MQCFIEAGADVNAKTVDGLTPLQMLTLPGSHFGNDVSDAIEELFKVCVPCKAPPGKVIDVALDKAASEFSDVFDELVSPVGVVDLQQRSDSTLHDFYLHEIAGDMPWYQRVLHEKGRSQVAE